MSNENTALARLLKRVYLGGVIDECVMESVDGHLRVEAMDLTGQLFLSCGEESSLLDEGEKWGLGDLPALCGFFEKAEEGAITLKRKDNRVHFKFGKGTDHQGSMRYLLSEIEVIPTAVDDPDALDELESSCEYEAELTERACEDFLMFMALLKVKGVRLYADKKKVYFDGGHEAEHQFETPIGPYEPVTKKGKMPSSPFSILVSGDHLRAVIQAVDFDSDEYVPVIRFAPDRPIVVRQDDTNVWVVAPIIDSE